MPLLFVQAVLVEQLLIYLCDTLAPVDVGGGSEVLEGDVTPNIFTVHLSNLKDSKHCSTKLGLNISQA